MAARAQVFAVPVAPMAWTPPSTWMISPVVAGNQSLSSATTARAAVPSGASTGQFEAVELRDGDADRYLGKGVLTAVDAVNGEIADAILGFDATDQRDLDRVLCEIDGTDNNDNLHCCRGADDVGHHASGWG